MEELKFTIKSLIFAVAITLLMQIDVGNSTMEERAEMWVRTTKVPNYLQQVAHGAVKAGRSLQEMLSKEVSKLNHPKISGTGKSAASANSDANQETSQARE